MNRRSTFHLLAGTLMAFVCPWRIKAAPEPVTVWSTTGNIGKGRDGAEDAVFRGRLLEALQYQCDQYAKLQGWAFHGTECWITLSNYYGWAGNITVRKRNADYSRQVTTIFSPTKL